MINLEEYKKTFNILYIEDDKALVHKIKLILQKIFKSVFVASNGEEALKIFKSNNINLIISDINMPIIDGLTFLKNLRKINTDISFIFLTAKQEVNTIIDAIEYNISGYILKPIDLNNFLCIINKTVEKEYKKYINLQEKYLLKIDDTLTWNKQTRTLLKNNITIKLTKKELLLLELLLQYDDKVCTISEITYCLWDEEFEQKDYISNLKNIISRIRNKIPEIIIENIYGLGYRIKISK